MRNRSKTTLCFLFSLLLCSQVDAQPEGSASNTEITVPFGPAAPRITTVHQSENVAVENLSPDTSIDIYVDYKKEDQRYTCLRLIPQARVLSSNWAKAKDNVTITWLVTVKDAQKLELAKTIGRIQLCPALDGPERDCSCNEKKAGTPETKPGRPNPASSIPRTVIQMDGKEYYLGRDGELKERGADVDG